MSADEAVHYVQSLYDPLGYLDLYGGSVLAVALVTVAAIVVTGALRALAAKEALAADWDNNRCRPEVLPIAGYIVRSDDKTPAEATRDNLDACMQSILAGGMANNTKPLEGTLGGITALYNAMSLAVQNIRTVVHTIRNGVKNFTEDVLQRSMNVIVPIQGMMVSLMDTFGKIQGVMVAGLYSVLGGYFTLQSTMGAIIALLIKMLGVLAVIIAGLWITPVTWGAAGTMTAVFTSIAVPLAVIVAVLTKVLHVKGGKIPGLPKMRCFDPATEIEMVDGRMKPISTLSVGDCLRGQNYVTAVFELSAQDLDMVNIHGTVVSGNHHLRHPGGGGRIVRAREHPDAERLPDYTGDTLFCLNTSQKKISCGGVEYADWDDLLNSRNLAAVLDAIHYSKPEEIHAALDHGFCGDQQIVLANGDAGLICDARIGDVLLGNAVVYGTVRSSKGIHLLTTTDRVPLLRKNNNNNSNSNSNSNSNNKEGDMARWVSDYNGVVDAILR